MTPEDYELMNNILIAQSGRDEIVIQQQAERIRLLETQIKVLTDNIRQFAATVLNQPPK